MPQVPPRAALAAAALIVMLVFAPAALATDYSETALNVVPSGQYGAVPAPPNADEQAKLYDSLTPLFDAVTPADLTRSFKSERFGITPGEGPGAAQPVPQRPGVTLTRDRFNVPHIVGKTRDDVTWAMGYVLHQDRGLLLAQGRYPGRLAAIEAPNLNAFSLVTQLKAYVPTPQVDRQIERDQLRALRTAGSDGKALLHDVDVFLEGINARLKEEGSSQPAYRRADIFGFNALVGQIFGQGGGGEAPRAEFRSDLRRRLGSKRGDEVFDDLSENADADHPATLTNAFRHGQVPRGAGRGNATIDAGSLRTSEPTTGTLSTVNRQSQAAQPPHTSNFLTLTADRSTNGHPLFVAGPQIGYFYPGLTLEADIRGPGFQARGVYSPANAGTILIGRGEDFAWSLTSASSDLIDTYAEELCGGSTRKYRYRGRCLSMKRTNAGEIKGAGQVRFDSTVHGPVTGYARSNGKRVALSRKRSTYGQDILFELPFRDATIGRITGTKSFADSFARNPFTFNVAYADDRDIAMFSAGKLPLRDRRVDPRGVTKGDGRYEWKGFLAKSRHPQQVNSPRGTLTNWNNAPAPGWGATDNQYAYGSAHRVTLLEAGLAKRRKHDLASVTGAMNAAATQDLRSTALTSTLRKLLGDATPPSPRAKQMLDLLEAWRASGSSRLDRDVDGRMDAGAGPAIWDELYPRLREAVLRPRLGGAYDDFVELTGAQNSPASGFTGGAINHVDKALRQITGTRFRDPFESGFCGGRVTACRRAVYAALESTGRALERAQGTPDAAKWTADATKERIGFAPGVLPTTIRYTNRPSGIQQVISFSGHRPTRR
ncbi:MAG: penicillin acylase family protein [Solirubrobacterales bacterium]|nr:penicillin acylase family protein [Solirubrobacterales bacterium]